MMRRLPLFLLVVLLVPSMAGAEALLRLTPPGWSPSAYEAAGYPIHPTSINPDGFRLTYHGGGPQTLVDPVLLIIGVATGNTAPTLNDTLLGGVTDVNITQGGATVFGGSWAANGFAGTFNSSAGSQSVYQFIGLTDPVGGGADSESFVNWSGGNAAAAFSLYVYKLYFEPDFGKGDFVEFSSSLLPGGSYVVGYGLNPDQQTNATPFTFAGRVSVPEPASLSLLIPSLGLLFIRRRKANPSA